MRKKELTDLFIARTGESHEVACHYLERNGWSLPTAITFYLFDLNEGKI
ncbi:hypothetical protein [Mangrovibacter phragmitis]